jgi:type III secretory pathway lipoprotein EscJ
MPKILNILKDKRVIGGIIGLIGIFIIYSFIFSTQELHHNLSEEAANKILVLLQSNGLYVKKLPEKGRRKEITYKIVTLKLHAKKAWKLLEEHNLPREEEKGFSEVFQKKGMIPTPTEEKALFCKHYVVNYPKLSLIWRM